MPRVRLEGPADSVGLVEALPRLLERLPFEVLRRQRWFAAKTRPMVGVALRDHALVGDDPPLAFALVDVRFADGDVETYSLPLVLLPRARAPGDASPLLAVETPSGVYFVSDALADASSSLRLLDLIRDGATLPARHGRVVCSPTPGLSMTAPPRLARRLAVEQSNTSVLYGDACLLKSYRRLTAGPCRDAELARFFWDCTAFRATPRLLGTIEYRPETGLPTVLAVLHSFVPNQGDGWDSVRHRLSGLFARQGPRVGARRGLRRVMREQAADLLDDVTALARLTARMHSALGSRPDLAAYAPENVGPADLAAWADDARAEMRHAFDALASAPRANRRVSALVAALRRQQPAWEATVEALSRRLALRQGRKIQIHGDFHLGQVLKTTDGFVVIDFEGEPSRPIEERQAKQSPLRDVAGMLRSLSYVAAAAAGAPALVQPDQAALARAWEAEAARQYLSTYLEEMVDSGLLPADGAEVAREVTLFQLGKAFYELAYELNNRPDWVAIPMAALRRWFRLLVSHSARQPYAGE